MRTEAGWDYEFFTRAAVAAVREAGTPAQLQDVLCEKEWGLALARSGFAGQREVEREVGGLLDEMAGRQVDEAEVKPTGMKLWTSRFSNKAIAGSGLLPVRITVGHPRFKLAYQLAATYSILAPWGLRDVKDQAEFEKRYRERLDSTGAAGIRAGLTRISEANGGGDLVLLCFEDLTKGECHRRTFAEWWQERTGQRVDELPEAPAQNPTLDLGL